MGEFFFIFGLASALAGAWMMHDATQTLKRANARLKRAIDLNNDTIATREAMLQEQEP